MTYGPIDAPEMGRITFVSDSPHYAFTARLGDSSPTVTEGYGGWEVVARPRRRGLVEWKGNNPRSIEIGVLFDRFRRGTSVEDDIQQLEQMAGLYHPSDNVQPPYVLFHSNGVVPYDLHDAPNLQWVIANVVWGDSDRNPYGNRIRQAATITVWQHDDDRIVNTAAKKHRTKAKTTTPSQKAKHKTHSVVQGETLASIAAFELSDLKRWREIAKLNPKKGKPRRDTKDLTVGEVLKMP